MSRLIESGTTDGVGFGNADETDAPLNVAGEFNVAGTLNLDQALGISGVVLDDSQSPIQDANVGVTLTENGEDVIYETTDANGEYAFTEHPDGDSTKQEWHVTAAKNDNGDLFNAESKPFVRGTLVATAIQGTGGDVAEDITINGVDYRIHKFTSVGTQQFNITNAPAAQSLEYLIVGGGGAGGSGGLSAGGGAGGVIHNVNGVGLNPGTGLFTINVGAGGTPTNNRGPVNGEDSSAFGLTALGGGGGSSLSDARSDNVRNGNDGGSGGGSGDGDDGGQGGAGLQPTSASGGFGNDGGNAPGGGDHYPGAGGGGAGQPGESPANSNSAGGDGGDGIQVNIDGNNYYWGGGGGGGAYKDGFGAGDGGLGGGGGGTASGPAGLGGGLAINSGQDGQSTSGSSDTPGGAGGANTGGGGGGGDWGDSDGAYTGAPGGSGIVLIRYEI